MKRDLRIDSIRGLLLIIITIDHFGGWLKVITEQSLGYVSALEGFIFLSGFVFAQVYLKLADQASGLWKKSLSRANMVYRYNLLLLLSIGTLLYLSPHHRGYLFTWLMPGGDHPVYYFFQSLLLLHQPQYIDILPIYWVFVLMSPPLLLACHGGSGRLVILGSLLFWCLSALVNPLQWLSAQVCDGCRYGFLNLFAWQLIWVSGLYLGYRAYSKRPLQWVNNRFVILAAWIIALVLFLMRHHFLDLSPGAATGRESLGWLRLLNFYVLLLLIARFVSRFPPKAQIPWVSFIGRYSLQVFAFHVFMAYLILPYRGHNSLFGGTFGYLSGVLFLLSSLTIPAWFYRRYQARLQAAAQAVRAAS